MNAWPVIVCCHQLRLRRVTCVQVLLMCQLRHPNIISAEDIYLPSDIPVEQRDSAMRLQRSNADHICVRMPYYPADMAWLIHSSPQVLTREHVQVTLQPFHSFACALRAVFGLTRLYSTFTFRFCAVFGTLYFPRVLLTDLLTPLPDTCTLLESFTGI